MKTDKIAGNKLPVRERNHDIGALHLLAAFFVMLGHQCALTGQAPILLWGCGIQAIGVKIIFLLTGYLITRSLWETAQTPGRAGMIYFWKRCKRIYPELFVCLLGTAFIIGPSFSSLGMYDYFSDLVLLYVIANLKMYPVLTLPGMFEKNPYQGAVNGSLWTMPVEIACYVLSWIIYWIGNTEHGRKKCYIFLTITIIIAAMVRFIFFPINRLIIYGTDWLQALNIVPYFFIGGVVYLLKWKECFNLKLAAFFLLATSGIVFHKSWMNEMFCLIVLPYYVFSFFMGKGSKQSDVSIKILKSKYCYGIYLWGFPVQQCMIQKLYIEKAEPLNVWVIFFLSLIVTYFIAMLTYECIYYRWFALFKKVFRIHG